MNALTLELPEDYLTDLWVIYNFSVKNLIPSSEGQFDVQLDKSFFNDRLSDLLEELGDDFKVLNNDLFLPDYLRLYKLEALRSIACFNPLIFNQGEVSFISRGNYSSMLHESFKLTKEKIIYGLELVGNSF